MERPGGSADCVSQLSHPTSMAGDSRGNLYIVDSGNDAVRVINSSGIIGFLERRARRGEQKLSGSEYRNDESRRWRPLLNPSRLVPQSARTPNLCSQGGFEHVSPVGEREHDKNHAPCHIAAAR